MLSLVAAQQNTPFEEKIKQVSGEEHLALTLRPLIGRCTSTSGNPARGSVPRYQLRFYGLRFTVFTVTSSIGSFYFLLFLFYNF